MTDPKHDVKRTPLYRCHEEADARLVEFAGWEMPVQYSGLIAEHRAVRTAAGIFDVSHMGEISVRGKDAERALQQLTPNDVSMLTDGRIHYSGLLTDRGTYIDDLLIYRIAADEFLLVVNAANAAADLEWIQSRAEGEVEVEDRSDDYALIAVQGPMAPAVLQRLTDTDLGAIRYYRFVRGEVAGVEGIISCTGYTGEAGFELYLPPAGAAEVWRRLLDVGAADGLVPAGLGARDTLRMEAAMALYGHEIDLETTPLEAGLSWVVKMAKGDFIGRDALAAQKESGTGKRLIGFEVEGRGIARQGHPVWIEGEEVGAVTSGTFSPTLERALGMAYVPTAAASPGAGIEIEVRRRRLTARQVELPFYRREK